MTSFADAGGSRSHKGRKAWGCGGIGRLRWRPIEIAALVLGFALYWPIGLAIIGLKFAQRRGYTFDETVSAMRDRFGGFGSSTGGRQWRPFDASSGNAAFDDWRKAEMERLEEERRKLDAAARDFADHLDNLRKARDREEFDRFMQARASQAGRDAS